MRIRYQYFQEEVGLDYPLDWNTWLDHALQSKKLTPTGKQYISRMVETFVDFFGDNPIKDPEFIFWEPAIAGLHPGNDVPQVYYRLTNLYVLIRLAQIEEVPGFHQLRKKIAHSPSGESFRHLTMQLEVAGFAFRDGDLVEFEPRLGKNKEKTADIRLQDQHMEQKFDMEMCSLRIAQETVNTTTYYDAFEQLLTELSFEFNVKIQGKVMGIPPEEYMDDIIKKLTNTYRTVSKYGGRKQRKTKWHRITCTPGNGNVEFPEIVRRVPRKDWWPRYYSTIKKKAKKTPDDAIWIRLDDVSGFFHFSEFSFMNFRDRLRILAFKSRQLFNEAPNLRGIVLTNHGDVQFDPDQRTHYGSNIAIRRKLPTLFTRETFILPRGNSEFETAQKIASWFENEATWLPWALQRLEIPELCEIAPISGKQ